MNKTTKMITKLVTLSLVAATTLHATNGDNLIAVGTKARSMGGVSIAMSHGAESGLGNSALITSVEGTEISFGGTLFMPDIETTFNGIPAPSATSDADINMIPEVSIAHKINDNWYIGVGMWGTAGLGVDYSNAPTGVNANMVTNLQLLQFAVPIAYKNGGLSLAVTPVMQYGNLDINYDGTGLGGGQTGAGLAQDFGFGYNLGVAYDFNNGLTLGALYKSSIEMNYDNQLSTAMAGFGIVGFSDTLEQPSEYGVGIAYTTGQHTFAFDYKKMNWSDAKGYKDFGWEDSDIYAFGYQYAQDNWELRAGFNYGKSAVVEQAQDGTALPSLNNTLNLLGFPATSEKHYTFGGSYGFTEQFSLDLAYVYSPTSTKTFSTAGFPMSSVTTDHTEHSVSFQLAYKF